MRGSLMEGGQEMVKMYRFLTFVVGFSLLAPCLLAADYVIIQVQFFQGKWSEGEPPLKQIEIYMAASHPEISALKAKAEGSKVALKAAIVDTLLGLTNMRTVDDLFSFEKPWRGRVDKLIEVVSSNEATFLFIFIPKTISPRKLTLQTAIYKSKQVGDPFLANVLLNKELYKSLSSGKFGGRVEKVLDTTLDLEMGEPAIVAMPAESGAYFMSVMLTSGQSASGKMEFAGGPKAVYEVTPVYPTELREKGVEGQVELEVGINEEGGVEAVKVTKSLHPYLDNAAVQALKQWRFEPVLRNGKPVSAIITTDVNFNREAYRRQEELLANKGLYSGESESASQILLRDILEGSADYCQKLLDSAFDYICEETIRDVFYNYKTPEELKKSAVVLTIIGGDDLLTQMGVTRFTAAHGRTERNEYVCDYLLIKKADMIESRRIILKENGYKLPDRTKHLEEKRISSLVPLLEPVKILGRVGQRLFDYRILQEEKVHGKDSYVIEATPKLGDAGGIEYGKIWVRKKNFQVLKIEISGVPLEGYESVLKELTQYNLKAKFITTFLYKVEKKGIAFPSSVALRVKYPFPGMEPQAYISEKISTDMRYDKYKFFIVDTESDIRK